MTNQRLAHQHGFTLIELMIALSLFAVLSAMAFGGLNHLLSQHQQLQLKQQRFANIQSAIQVVERDLSQLLPRSVRDAFGDRQAALIGGATPEFTYALTTKVWFNPHSPQGNLLQRVSYQWQGQKLWRVYETQLDAGVGASPVRYTLLDQVTGFSLRFLPANGQWINYWPPINTAEGSNLNHLPKAIDVYLTTADNGTIRRLLEIPQGQSQAPSQTPGAL
jgi:general secretion pathway protein J